MPTTKGFYIGLMFDHAAARHRSAPVVLDTPLQLSPEDGTSVTVGRLSELVREVAGRLVTAGVRPGDRVAVYKTNNFDIALVSAAVQRVGAVPALFSPMLTGETASGLLARLDSPWLLTDAEKYTASGVDGTAARRILLVAGDELPGTESLSRHPVASLRGASVPAPDAPAFISHTSGTTGLPKLVVQTPDALYQRLRLQRLVASWVWRRETVALCVSFVHARFYSALDLGMSFGNPLLVAVDGSPENIGPFFARHRPGAVETQPNTFIDWETLAEADGRPLSSVRYYSATFDAMHPRTIQNLLGASVRRSPKFIQLYGQTETGPVAGRFYTARGAVGMDGRCVGWPLPGVIRMRVTGDDGRAVRAGTVGHIEVRSRTRAVTYLKEDARFAEQQNGSWWRMGDLGFMDRWGRLHMLDREIDSIDSVGSNLEIEDTLMERLPELREVVVLGGLGARPVPVVCTRGDEPLDAERWQLALSGLPELAGVVELPFDRVPRTSTWKVRRPDLIRMLEKDGIRG
ncbi:class I adenylate-forming enzyme family protein [Actinacidiphila sp. ITFR-21]|uniref:class I adenylate-forming enzyme family protein n=1 Tax=Actinacidiphila sp. ITFR-21 TaxID=3075199 RepID=UPI002889B7E9|nr:class I adenylate-forming enzyme family protein [Streptomyces sp. ITFR-21]WNI18894.1 class I adenylate-forming enzyme family protein [Streptomyces sp. ITFR-21]